MDLFINMTYLHLIMAQINILKAIVLIDSTYFNFEHL